MRKRTHGGSNKKAIARPAKARKTAASTKPKTTTRSPVSLKSRLKRAVSAAIGAAAVEVAKELLPKDPEVKRLAASKKSGAKPRG